jgi:hypothetical protein
VFDTRAPLQDGSLRATEWDNIEPTALLAKRDGTLLLGQIGYIGEYEGYLDNASTYRFAYYTNHADLGDPNVTSILKRISVVVIGGSNQFLTLKWGFDFSENYLSQNVQIPAQNTYEYGIAEYNIAEYAGGVALQTLYGQGSGSGKIVQTGYEADVNGYPLSIQKIEIQAKNGRVS